MPYQPAHRRPCWPPYTHDILPLTTLTLISLLMALAKVLSPYIPCCDLSREATIKLSVSSNTFLALISHACWRPSSTRQRSASTIEHVPILFAIPRIHTPSWFRCCTSHISPSTIGVDLKPPLARPFPTN
ncbi:hypothetical protein GOBAR_DD32204 [Gossypium barbadense]|nr:hypothetical protein GOBAR_DD32204 [Gossypium barbadense]